MDYASLSGNVPLCNAMNCPTSHDSNYTLLLPTELHYLDYTPATPSMDCTVHCTVLYHCTAPYCNVLHRTALSHHMPYSYWTALHCTAPHCTALHWTAPHGTTLYCAVLYSCIALYSTLSYYTALYGTAPHHNVLH